jgi:hypothetical protein
MPWRQFSMPGASGYAIKPDAALALVKAYRDLVSSSRQRHQPGTHPITNPQLYHGPQHSGQRRQRINDQSQGLVTCGYLPPVDVQPTARDSLINGMLLKLRAWCMCAWTTCDPHLAELKQLPWPAEFLVVTGPRIRLRGTMQEMYRAIPQRALVRSCGR